MATDYNVAEGLLRNAIAEREDRCRALDREKDNLDKEIRDLNRDLAHLVSLHNNKEGQESPLQRESAVRDPAPEFDSDFWNVTHAEGSLSKGIKEAILVTLVAERPMHRKKLLEKVEAQGIILGGSDRIRTLSSYLSGDRRFVPVSKGRGIWTLADEPPDEIVTAIHSS